VVCCAALTSRLLEALAGRISTVVSVRSAAMNRMCPAGMSRTAETGAGVSNFCVVLWFFCMVCSFDSLFLMIETLRCIHGFGNRVVAHDCYHCR
jgi:hypothetical protein